jgi:ATP/maltotriose-dependent transcriptional regulator MalT
VSSGEPGVTFEEEVAMGIVDDLVQGREAFERRQWRAAHDRLSSPDLAALNPADLDALATAAYLVGDLDTCVRAWQRAFGVHADAGATLPAVRAAFWIAFVLNTTGNAAVGGGWVARAQRLLVAEPDDVVEHGYLKLHAMYGHIFAGEYAEAFELAAAATESGRHFGDPDLVAEGLSSQGRLLMYGGNVPDGLAMLDEAMVSVAAGEVSPIVAGMAFCSMIEACQEIGDYRRMTDWTSALTRWCEEQPDLAPFTGQCAVHRAQIMRAQGAFAQALDELELAQARYEANGMDPAVGLALYERGEVLRLRGEHDVAAVAYDAAAAYGRQPQPGLALLWLARGRTAAAVAAVHRLLDETPDPVHRSQLLPAAVEVLLAGGELDAARAASEELDGIASSFRCAALAGAASYARGTVALAESDAAAALPHLRRAWKVFLDLGARYDAARTRTRIGLAFRALGDEDSAAAELAVARRTFGELGAATARSEVDRFLGPSLPDGLTAREVEVLRLVAAGQSNPQIAAVLFLSEKTVARHLSNIFGKTHVSSRTAATAYAYEHELV